MNQIEFNDQGLSWPADKSLAELVAEQQSNTQGIAVVVNGEIVPQSAWNERCLSDGDKVKVFRAIAGG
ncbi:MULTISPECIES: sulfur carrier protein ThiS [Aliagarivorans]|uniref:sulfur carrier protein ThiS n=1 Tax=Aliagarivorans TaxID=882379 RepID=UPI0004295F4E|nr:MULTISPECIES: sulfur carrier protein ThiS [Aliagarivorans]